jgi:Ca2+-binding RTX toxin-like protein
MGMNRSVLLLASVALAVLLASGVALAAEKQCTPNVRCVGTDGGDTLLGTNGPDDISGLEARDFLYGFGGSDRLFGGKGSDELTGGYATNIYSSDDDGANDTLTGGTGSDRYAFRDGWGEDTIVDQAASDNDLFTGNEVDIEHPSTSSLIITLKSDSGPLPEVSEGTNTINWDGNAVDNVSNFGYGDDTITGNIHANRIHTGPGNDTVFGRGGGDAIEVDDQVGGDTVDCGGGDDFVSFDTGDTISPNCEHRFERT